MFEDMDRDTQRAIGLAFELAARRQGRREGVIVALADMREAIRLLSARAALHGGVTKGVADRMDRLPKHRVINFDDLRRVMRDRK